MRWKSIPFLFLTMAVMVLNLHAIIPHTHVESYHDISVSAEKTPSSPFDDLRHIDLGEDHLEVFKLSPSFKIIYVCQIEFASTNTTALALPYWFFPLEENAIPPPLIGSNSLRAPPVFA